MFVKGLNSKPRQVQMPNRLSLRNLTARSRDGVILILGTDGRIGEKSDETRTDSIMVVNVNNKEGKIKMVSFMRILWFMSMEWASKIFQSMMATTTRSSIRPSLSEQNNNHTIGPSGCSKITLTLTSSIGHGRFQDLATAIDTLFPNGVEMNAQFSTVDGESQWSEVPDDLNMKDGVVPQQSHQGWKTTDGWPDPSITRVSVRTMMRLLVGLVANKRSCPLSWIRSRIQPNFTGPEALGEVFARRLPSPFFLLTKWTWTSLCWKGIERGPSRKWGLSRCLRYVRWPYYWLIFDAL